MRAALNLPKLKHFAASLACIVRSGDVIALSGDLGAGKTTFARFLITAILGRDEEIPSPTFSLLQSYDAPRMAIAHFDLYRLSDASELFELGFEEEAAASLVLVEWPERAGALMPPTKLEVTLRETDDPDIRDVVLRGDGGWTARLARFEARTKFLESCGWGAAAIDYLQGDASTRSYAKMSKPGAKAILMDAPPMADGPPVRGGLPYSRIAHLAEDMRPFVAVARALRNGGLSAPEIFCEDLDQGFAVLEDLGNALFGADAAAGEDQELLWRGAVDALLALRQLPVPGSLALSDGSRHTLACYDRGALQIEAELLVDWFWPAFHGNPAPAEARDEFLALWQPILDRLQEDAGHWVLRDFHSPNLLWLPDRAPPANIGIIDFQDAMRGPAAYDLVSLLQDARVDVAAALEADLLAHYCARVLEQELDFDCDEFEFSYAALGAQRATKILGIFARLARRDGKPGYLKHMPRIWRYLERDLAHPQLAGLRAWYDRHFAADRRAGPLASPP